MLKIAAIPNCLPTVKKPFMVHTVNRESVSFEQLVDRMAEGRTTVSKPDIVANMQLLVEQLFQELANGAAVKLPIGTFYMCASGTFDAIDQPFVYGEGDNGHDLRLHFRANRAEEIGMARLMRVQREPLIDKTAPRLFSAESVRTDEELVAAPGDFVRVHGHHLKFDKADPALGLWFVNGSEHRAGQYASVEPSTVIAQVPPDLEPGQYSLVVRTSPNEKDVKESRLPDPVSVA